MSDYRATKNDDSTTNEAKAPITKSKTIDTSDPMPEPAVPVSPPDNPIHEGMLLAEARAIPPNDEQSEGSPLFGVAGIEGGLERGSIERRFKPRAQILQRCFERNGSEPGLLWVKMQVAPDGKISEMTLTSDASDSFQACVMAALNFTFSPTRDGENAYVVQPIAFR
jgi:hypothetical protein